MDIERRKLRPPEIAAMFGISVNKVHTWIRTGQLRAIDASTHRGGRPRYLVDVDDLAAFERSRSTVPEPKPQAPRRRSRDEIPQYV